MKTINLPKNNLNSEVPVEDLELEDALQIQLARAKLQEQVANNNGDNDGKIPEITAVGASEDPLFNFTDKQSKEVLEVYMRDLHLTAKGRNEEVIAQNNIAESGKVLGRVKNWTGIFGSYAKAVFNTPITMISKSGLLKSDLLSHNPDKVLAELTTDIFANLELATPDQIDNKILYNSVKILKQYLKGDNFFEKAIGNLVLDPKAAALLETLKSLTPGADTQNILNDFKVYVNDSTLTPRLKAIVEGLRNTVLEARQTTYLVKDQANTELANTAKQLVDAKLAIKGEYGGPKDNVLETAMNFAAITLGIPTLQMLITGPVTSGFKNLNESFAFQKIEKEVLEELVSQKKTDGQDLSEINSYALQLQAKKIALARFQQVYKDRIENTIQKTDKRVNSNTLGKVWGSITSSIATTTGYNDVKKLTATEDTVSASEILKVLSSQIEEISNMETQLKVNGAQKLIEDIDSENVLRSNAFSNLEVKALETKIKVAQRTSGIDVFAMIKQAVKTGVRSSVAGFVNRPILAAAGAFAATGITIGDTKIARGFVGQQVGQTGVDIVSAYEVGGMLKPGTLQNNLESFSVQDWTNPGEVFSENNRQQVINLGANLGQAAWNRNFFAVTATADIVSNLGQQGARIFSSLGSFISRIGATETALKIDTISSKDGVIILKNKDGHTSKAQALEKGGYVATTHGLTDPKIGGQVNINGKLETITAIEGDLAYIGVKTTDILNQKFDAEIGQTSTVGDKSLVFKGRLNNGLYSFSVPSEGSFRSDAVNAFEFKINKEILHSGDKISIDGKQFLFSGVTAGSDGQPRMLLSLIGEDLAEADSKLTQNTLSDRTGSVFARSSETDTIELQTPAEPTRPAEPPLNPIDLSPLDTPQRLDTPNTKVTFTQRVETIKLAVADTSVAQNDTVKPVLTSKGDISAVDAYNAKQEASTVVAKPVKVAEVPTGLPSNADLNSKPRVLPPADYINPNSISDPNIRDQAAQGNYIQASERARFAVDNNVLGELNTQQEKDFAAIIIKSQTGIAIDKYGENSSEAVQARKDAVIKLNQLGIKLNFNQQEKIKGIFTNKEEIYFLDPLTGRYSKNPFQEIQPNNSAKEPLTVANQLNNQVGRVPAIPQDPKQQTTTPGSVKVLNTYGRIEDLTPSSIPTNVPFVQNGDIYVKQIDKSGKITQVKVTPEVLTKLPLQTQGEIKTLQAQLAKSPQPASAEVKQTQTQQSGVVTPETKPQILNNQGKLVESEKIAPGTLFIQNGQVMKMGADGKVAIVNPFESTSDLNDVQKTQLRALKIAQATNSNNVFGGFQINATDSARLAEAIKTGKGLEDVISIMGQDKFNKALNYVIEQNRVLPSLLRETLVSGKIPEGVDGNTKVGGDTLNNWLVVRANNPSLADRILTATRQTQVDGFKVDARESTNLDILQMILGFATGKVTIAINTENSSNMSLTASHQYNINTATEYKTDNFSLVLATPSTPNELAGKEFRTTEGLPVSFVIKEGKASSAIITLAQNGYAYAQVEIKDLELLEKAAKGELKGKDLINAIAANKQTSVTYTTGNKAINLDSQKLDRLLAGDLTVNPKFVNDLPPGTVDFKNVKAGNPLEITVEGKKIDVYATLASSVDYVATVTGIPVSKNILNMNAGLSFIELAQSRPEESKQVLADVAAYRNNPNLFKENTSKNRYIASVSQFLHQINDKAPGINREINNGVFTQNSASRMLRALGSVDALETIRANNTASLKEQADYYTSNVLVRYAQRPEIPDNATPEEAYNIIIQFARRKMFEEGLISTPPRPLNSTISDDLAKVMGKKPGELKNDGNSWFGGREAWATYKSGNLSQEAFNTQMGILEKVANQNIKQTGSIYGIPMGGIDGKAAAEIIFAVGNIFLPAMVSFGTTTRIGETGAVDFQAQINSPEFQTALITNAVIAEKEAGRFVASRMIDGGTNNPLKPGWTAFESYKSLAESLKVSESVINGQTIYRYTTPGGQTIDSPVKLNSEQFALMAQNIAIRASEQNPQMVGTASGLRAVTPDSLIIQSVNRNLDARPVNEIINSLSSNMSLEAKKAVSNQMDSLVKKLDTLTDYKVSSQRFNQLVSQNKPISTLAELNQSTGVQSSQVVITAPFQTNGVALVDSNVNGGKMGAGILMDQENRAKYARGEVAEGALVGCEGNYFFIQRTIVPVEMTPLNRFLIDHTVKNNVVTFATGARRTEEEKSFFGASFTLPKPDQQTQTRNNDTQKQEVVTVEPTKNPRPKLDANGKVVPAPVSDPMSVITSPKTTVIPTAASGSSIPLSNPASNSGSFVNGSPARLIPGAAVPNPQTFTIPPIRPPGG